MNHQVLQQSLEPLSGLRVYSCFFIIFDFFTFLPIFGNLNMNKAKTAILITGALGGLGTALVEMSRNLPDIDCIIATDINKDIENAYTDDGKVVGFPMDVSSEKSIRQVHNELQRESTSIKYLVNCAGIANFHAVSESTEELLDKTLKVNTYGPVLTVSIFLSDLIQNRGRVIQISSVSVKLPTLFQPYPNSKIALEALSTSMRQELKLQRVKLILIRPGAINTKLTKEMQFISNPVANSQYKTFFDKFVKIAQSDIGKMIEPEKVAQLVCKVLRVKNPRQVYSINKNLKISLVTLIPKRWRDFLITNAVKKNK